MRKFLVGLLLCLVSVFGWGDVHVAASASYADVNTAVSGASVGDTVVVPAGTETWSTVLLITQGIRLIGNGVGSTVITSDISNINTGIVRYQPTTPANDDEFVIAGFTFDGADLSCCVYIRNTSDIPLTKVRVHHNRFTQGKTYGLMIIGPIYGVADHNQYDDNANSCTVLAHNQNTYDAISASYGDSHAFFVEDSTFSLFTSELFYGSNAGQYVFRYNTMTLPDKTGIMDQHGNNHDPVVLGYTAARTVLNGEIYENTFNSAYGSRLYIWMKHRGGGLLMYNNTLTGGSASSFIRLTEYDVTTDNLIPAICTHNATNYICKQDHTSSSVSEPGVGASWTDYWETTVIVPTVYITWAVEIDFLYSTTYDPAIDTYFHNNLVGASESAVTPEGVTGSYWIENTNYWLKTPVGETIKGSVYSPYAYPHPAAENVIYVDYVSGSDANDGTSTTDAFKHCPGDDSATGNASELVLVVGDIMLFKGGVTYTGRIDADWSGEDDNEIVYLSGHSYATPWGTTPAVLSASGMSYSANTGAPFNIGTADYIVMQGFELQDVPTGTTMGAVYVTIGAEGIIIRECKITQSGSNGILLNGGDTVVVNNSIANVAQKGVLASAGITNYLYNCTIGGSTGSGIRTDAGVTVIAKNCYVGGSGGTDYDKDATGTMTLTTCYSEDGSQSTSVAAYSTSSGTYFVNVTSGSEDFDITNNSSLLMDEGTDLSGDTKYPFSIDINGTNRPINPYWDVGAYEISLPTSQEHIARVIANQMILDRIPGFEMLLGLCIASIIINVILLFLVYIAYKKIVENRKRIRFFENADNLSAWQELTKDLAGGE